MQEGFFVRGNKADLNVFLDFGSREQYIGLFSKAADFGPEKKKAQEQLGWPTNSCAFYSLFIFICVIEFSKILCYNDNTIPAVNTPSKFYTGGSRHVHQE